MSKYEERFCCEERIEDRGERYRGYLYPSKSKDDYLNDSDMMSSVMTVSSMTCFLVIFVETHGIPNSDLPLTRITQGMSFDRTLEPTTMLSLMAYNSLDRQFSNSNGDLETSCFSRFNSI